MGLAERRVVKSFQDGTYKELESKISAIAGKSFEMEIDWDSLAEDGMSHMYEEAFSKVYFSPLIEALESICSDEMGKEAISEGLVKIVIGNSDDNSNASKWASLEDKVLKLDHKPTTNIDSVSDRSKALQQVLEDNL